MRTVVSRIAFSKVSPRPVSTPVKISPTIKESEFKFSLVIVISEAPNPSRFSVPKVKPESKSAKSVEVERLSPSPITT